MDMVYRPQSKRMTKLLIEKHLNMTELEWFHLIFKRVLAPAFKLKVLHT